MPRSRSLGLVLLVGVVVLAGCAGGPAPSGETPRPAATATPVEDFGAANGTVEVHNINVGQSVSTLIIGPTGETMLIDTGHFQDDGEYVLEYLQRHNIDRIDYLITTHNDADHIGGNAAIIEYYETEANGIGAVYDPGIAASTNTYEEYLDAVETHDVTLYETREGDTIPFEGVDVAVLGPPEPYLENEARNENSIVLRLQYGQTSFLWTGDAEDDQEAYLVDEYGAALNATVYKVGHHGSSSSTSAALLDAVDPSVAVVSSAYDSQYSHPDEAVLGRLADNSVPTYWTATHGTVVFVSNGEGVSIRTQRAAPTDPRELRAGDPAPVGLTEPVTERARIGAAPAETATATPSPTVATDGGTPGPDALAVTTVHADAAGDDRENLNDEYVVFTNTGDAPLDLYGWTIRDEAGKTYTIPDGVTLDAGANITVHTGSGTNTETDLYWGAGSPVWNNAGDTVIVTTADGEEVLREVY